MNNRIRENDRLTDWFAGNASVLSGLDPASPLDDLEPLREIVGSARVVAIGENSHYIREFSLVRHRILRFLVERCGFTVLAHESGFSEGFTMASWIEGAGSDEDLDHLVDSTIAVGLARPAEARAMLRWMRERNRRADTPVRFAGIDLPMAAGSLLPNLLPLREYLTDVDPDSVPLLNTALGIAERTAGTSLAQAAPAWSELDPAEQDALTSALARLLFRFQSLAPQHVAHSDQRRYDTALWQLRGACQADYHLRAMFGLISGTPLSGDMSVRDIYMAESVRWHLDHSEPGTRIVLLAHNAHIQKTPAYYGGPVLTALPTGQHLQQMLGDDYVSIGVTSGGGDTAALYPGGAEPFGISLQNVALEAPEPGSIEGLFASADLGLSLVNLREAPRSGQAETEPDRIRMDSEYVHTPVLDAFDAVVHVPASTVADDLGF
ncbi:erythromycin esterase family protein [Streptoalloteichus hindustanus]|uniref:Erythromycin esterase n=1 Tax=Streptoalloteichus hindustanus TaxID=2017 RepID=A0A1M4ZDZ6_STRHI|nr:erythromycin esterase family protein [Streptoalloteichus hindustanus]SHF16264.1 erythromycin esterase [Streptoalloteichus hindustanus]